MEEDVFSRIARRHPFLFAWLSLLGPPLRFLEEFKEEVFHGDLEAFFEGLLRRLVKLAPPSLIRERSLPSGETIREVGPFILGLYLKLTGEGKPFIKTFGNVKLSRLVESPFDVLEVREPLYEIEDEGETLKVTFELPGAVKEEISLSATESTLTVEAKGRGRTYRREVKLPVEVEPKAGRSTYADGLLEVYLPKRKKPRPPVEPIKVE